MFTRRVRALEAKLAAAGAASGGTSKAASASSSRRNSAVGTTATASATRSRTDVDADVLQGVAGGAAALQSAAAATDAEAPPSLSELSGSSALRLRERQVVALTAQLDERTSQVDAEEGRVLCAAQCCSGHTVTAGRDAASTGPCLWWYSTVPSPIPPDLGSVDAHRLLLMRRCCSCSRRRVAWRSS
jgi:hypothetical protein